MTDDDGCGLDRCRTVIAILTM